MGFLGSLIVGGLGLLANRSAKNEQAAQNRAYAEAAARRQNLIAGRTWRQQIKQIHQQYLNQVREREWSHWNSIGEFYRNEVDRAAGFRLRESKDEFDLAVAELSRVIKYDLDKIAYKREQVTDRDKYDQRAYEINIANKEGLGSVEQANFDVEMRFLADQHRKALNDLELGYLDEIEGLDDKSRDSIATQKYNIAVGEIQGEVFAAQLKGNKLLNKNRKESLERFGQRLAIGQSGNSTIRLLTDIAIDKAGNEAEVLNEMNASVGLGIVAEAKAKLRLAEDLRRELRSAKRVTPGAVLGQRSKWFDLPELQPYREAPELPKFMPGPGMVHARYIRGVAPIRGPKVPLPEYPLAPIPVTADEIMGGSSGSGLSNALGLAADIGKLVFNHLPTPAANAPSPYSYKSGAIRISDQVSANTHPMGGGWFS